MLRQRTGDILLMSNVKIESRKTTDRGGYLMMPLQKNVPIPSDEWRCVHYRQE